jgi:hypothetical protein
MKNSKDQNTQKRILVPLENKDEPSLHGWWGGKLYQG